MVPITGARFLAIKEATALNKLNNGSRFSWLSLIVELILENADLRPFSTGSRKLTTPGITISVM
jgi:hypothetical protein